MRAIEKRLRERLKEKDEQLDRLRTELYQVREDRKKYREYLVTKLKWFIELNGKGSHPLMGPLILDVSQFFQRVEHWYW